MPDLETLPIDFKKKVVEWRRMLHAIPEPGFEEVETAETVAGVLTQLGYKVERGIARTGVLAEAGSGPAVLIRCEMDGIKVQEQLAVPYVSKNSGLMHACGHDANMACVLGAAELLKEEDLNCMVKIFMQPSSESIHAEDRKSGSNKSIEEGVLEGVEILFGLHVDATISSGSAGILENRLDARIDKFTIELSAEPDVEGANAMVSGARVLEAIYKEIAAYPAYRDKFQIHALTDKSPAKNSTEAVITGSFESLGRDAYSFFDKSIRQALPAGKSDGGKIELKYSEPAQKAHAGDQAIKNASKAAVSVVGSDKVNSVARKGWSNDFFPYSSTVSSALILLGVGSSGKPSILHTSTFDMDERSLYLGSMIIAEAVKEYSRNLEI